MSEAAVMLYKNVHDEIVEFRKNDSFEEEKLSINLKSLGLIVRVSAVICLLREASRVLKEHNEIEKIIKKEYFQMEIKVVHHSNSTSFSPHRKVLRIQIR